VIGGLALWLLNIFGGAIGINIGINVVTALVAGILGVPGVILLIILIYLK
jgi:inhibitor of the pro-sigma K processing machinery